MKISLDRWKIAQGFEFGEWHIQKDLAKIEWEEAKGKYGTYLSNIQKKLNIKDTSNILDVGCGPTCVSRLITKGHHFGIDPLIDSLGVSTKVKGIKVHNGMAEDMKMFKSNTFDFVFCRNVIDHTFSPDKVLMEISRVLKPTGYVLLASYVYNPFISFVKNLGEHTTFLRNVGHPHAFTPSSLEKLFEKEFEIVERKVVYQGVNPNDFGKLADMKATLSPVQKLIMYINDNILRNKWFVREYALLGKLKKGVTNA